MAETPPPSPAEPTPAAARIVHRTARRLRLRVADRRHDRAFFAALGRALGTIPAIERTLLNPATASVLIEFGAGDADAVAEALSQLELLVLPAPGSDPSQRRLDRLPPGVGGALQLADAVRTGQVDRRALALLVFLALLFRRLMKGGYLAPTLAFAWLLYEVYRQAIGGRGRR